jgi:uncharacterized protein (TIGR00251 family)
LELVRQGKDQFPFFHPFMQLEGALRAIPDGVTIRVKVTPSSRYLEVGRYDVWRRAIHFKLTGPAHKGKANDELLSYLAALFNKPATEVRLVSGHSSSLKVVLLGGTNVQEVQSIINQAIENAAKTQMLKRVAPHR